MQRVRDSIITKSRAGFRPAKLLLLKNDADPLSPAQIPQGTDNKTPNRIFLKKSKVVFTKDR